ncbi:membrane-spanning 4-domains subfamily A member 8-like [Anguilla anguilla]|uniref:membrane-spanning 4-domains subfamily A member 8-like n=1 Tax=Anguilla anguilla TaxID=7936 RepID=UPI0015B0C8F8|nr:membrane-spanning 4-domains subfamily A member 8-like [Anguilla anguilla]
MALSVTKGEGVTVLTIPSDAGRTVPVGIQLLVALCCSPWCYVSQGMRRLLTGTQTSLGTVQIMVGLINIGLGAVLLSVQYYTVLSWTSAPYWLGAVFIAAGLMSILGERFPSPCLVSLTAFMNMASACLAVTAIVLCSVGLAQGLSAHRMCRLYETSPYQRESYYGYGRPTLSPEELRVKDQLRRTNFEMCQSMGNILSVMLGGIYVLLILFAVLQLCVSIATTVLGIKALCNNSTKGKAEPDPELYKPIVEEVTTTPTV